MIMIQRTALCVFLYSLIFVARSNIQYKKKFIFIFFMFLCVLHTWLVDHLWTVEVWSRIFGNLQEAGKKYEIYVFIWNHKNKNQVNYINENIIKRLDNSRKEKKKIEFKFMIICICIYVMCRRENIMQTRRIITLYIRMLLISRNV